MDFHLTYEKANGKISERMIKVNSIRFAKGKGSVILIANDEEGLKSFDFDGIVSLARADTGEEVTLPALIEELAAMATDAAGKLLANEMAVMVSLALADGRICERETELMQDFIRKNARGMSIDAKAIFDRAVKKGLPKNICIRDVVRDANLFGLLKDLAIADGVISEEEEALLKVAGGRRGA